MKTRNTNYRGNALAAVGIVLTLVLPVNIAAARTNMPPPPEITTILGMVANRAGSRRIQDHPWKIERRSITTH